MVKQNTTPHIIGVLSDTHLSAPDERFRKRVELAFRQCDTIIHAGDLTDLGILEAFGDRRIIGVHGNMCNHRTRTALPEHLHFNWSGFRIVVCHGRGGGFDIEDRLHSRFPEADCIVYGHTHRQANHLQGRTRYLNPGSFQGTGRYGSPGGYAIMTITRDDLSARLHSLPTTP